MMSCGVSVQELNCVGEDCNTKQCFDFEFWRSMVLQNNFECCCLLGVARRNKLIGMTILFKQRLLCEVRVHHLVLNACPKLEIIGPVVIFFAPEFLGLRFWDFLGRTAVPFAFWLHFCLWLQNPENLRKNSFWKPRYSGTQHE